MRYLQCECVITGVGCNRSRRHHRHGGGVVRAAAVHHAHGAAGGQRPPHDLGTPVGDDGAAFWQQPPATGQRHLDGVTGELREALQMAEDGALHGHPGSAEAVVDLDDAGVLADATTPCEGMNVDKVGVRHDLFSLRTWLTEHTMCPIQVKHM